MADETRTDSDDGGSGPGRTLAPHIIVVHHAEERFLGLRRRLGRGQVLLFGREGDALGPGGLDDSRISRRHAEISWDGAAVRVVDLDSRNGTRHNGARVVTARLRDNDVVSFGSLSLAIRSGPAMWPSPPVEVGLVAESLAMRELLVRADLAATAPGPVLLTGETGVGKELLARRIHRSSGRSGSFVAINCGALPDELLHAELFGHARGAFSGAVVARRGLVAEADGGTLLLDEIGEASAAFQAALLRVLQEGEVRPLGENRVRRVDVRVVCATLRDVERAIAAGTFREDLYARIARWVLAIPPLRERREDVLPIGRAVARRVAGRPVRLRARLAEALLCAPWPRNVRDVEAVVERLVVEQPGVDALDLTAEIEVGLVPAVIPAEVRGERPSREDLLAALRAEGGNVTRCAKRLGCGRNTLYRWLREGGIEVRNVPWNVPERPAER